MQHFGTRIHLDRSTCGDRDVEHSFAGVGFVDGEIFCGFAVEPVVSSVGAVGAGCEYLCSGRAFVWV